MKSVLGELRTKFRLDLVVMTQGAEGAILAHADGMVEQPGVPANLVDTVGAGDSFTASMTLGLLQGKEHTEILSRCLSDRRRSLFPRRCGTGVSYNPDSPRNDRCGWKRNISICRIANLLSSRGRSPWRSTVLQ